MDKKVLKFFPDLDAYIDMLNKAVSIEDMELIDHLAGENLGLIFHRKRL